MITEPATDNIKNNPENIKKLCTVIERTTGMVLVSPKDFIRLSESVFAATHTLVSPSTLMRLWGYIKSDVNPRMSTLTLLSRFVGYKSWADLCSANVTERESNVVVTPHIKVSEDLKPGQMLRLTWMPNRICDIRYLGNEMFKVEYAENTGLKKGAFFSCPIIIEGEALYLEKVQQEGISVGVYVCGKRTGVSFTFI